MTKNSIEIKQVITQVLQGAIISLFGDREEVKALFSKHGIDRPADLTHGEYATSIALTGSKVFGLSSVESGIKITAKLNDYVTSGSPEFNASFAELVSKIEVAGPGFINFYLTPPTIESAIQEAVTSASYGKLSINTGKKIAYEYTDPNPFKVFHIGHLMANTVGEALSRLGEFTGADIKRCCYQGDIGRHVALFIYGLRLMDKPFPTAEEGEKMTLVERMYYMGTSYAKGATYFKEHPEAETEVQNINKKLYEKSDEEINVIYNLGLEWSLQYFETLYALLGTKFDQYFFESVCVEPARILIADGLQKGIFTVSDEATVFEGEKFQDETKKEKLHTRVFITKFGLPTYDAKELGLAKLKYEAFKYDQGIVVTANEQDQYFKVNLKVQSLILPELAGKNTHISHGMMVLPTGKMSSRTGDVVSAEEMFESARAYALEVMKDREMSEEEKFKVASQVAVAGIKYIILRQSSGKDVIYDVKKAISFEGDSGPYLQYTAVRARSIIAKATEGGITTASLSGIVGDKSLSPEASDICRKLFVFPEIVERAYKDNASHLIATYVIELAGQFNAFYANNKIVDLTDESTKKKSAELVSLTHAVNNTLTNGMYILGIEVPSKM